MEEVEEHPYDRWKRHDRLEFPLRHPDVEGIVVDEYAPCCNSCREVGKDIRGSVLFRANCMEVEAGTLCPPCKIITWTKTRFYQDYCLHRTGNGWVEVTYESGGWLEKIKSFFNRLLQ